MALVKLSQAMKAEYEAPYPDRKTALRHFQERYRVEKRGGSWWVDRSSMRQESTGNNRLDDIVRRLQQNG